MAQMLISFKEEAGIREGYYDTLFDSLAGRLINSPDLKTMLRSMLIGGNRIAYNPQQDTIAQMEMHGFITNVNGAIAVSSRIFETVLYNLFLSDEESRSNSFAKEGDADRNRFIRDGRLDVRLILERFIAAYTEIMGPLTDRFSEKDGRELFLIITVC